MYVLLSRSATKNEIANAARATTNCVCFNVRKAARLISQNYDKVLKPFGLNAGQFSILSLLGAIPEPMTVSEAADALGMERTTLTRNLHLLGGRGLTQTMYDDGDARVRRLSLTPKGWVVLADALPVWQAVQTQMLAHLGGQGWPELQQNLEVLGQRGAQ